MYSALIPSFAYEDFFADDGSEIYAWEGGLFHDGRAQDQFEQVQEPFFHPDEMNIPSPAALAAGLRESGYAEDFKRWIGKAAWEDDEKLNYHAFRALVEFLKEPLFRPFDARIDDHLAGDKAALTATEKRGLEVFKNVGKCADCHFLTRNSWPQPLLSDYGYDNLGVPSRGEKDPGLGGHTKNSGELGQFKAPTLRNIELTAPYMHNGSIATLQEVMEFYNKRDLEPERWAPTDYPETVNHDDMGDLGMTDQQVADLTALMSAFTDRSLLNLKTDDALPSPPPDVPTTESMKLLFPDWTHRLHPAFPRDSEL
jgi:cytochrome c peroxidase